MSKILLVSIVLILLDSCDLNKSRETNLKIQVNVMGRLGNNLFYDKSGTYDSVKIDMSNNTDTVFRFWSMSCSWTYNWISNNEKLYVQRIDCFANVPIINEIRPGEKISFNGIIHVLDTLNPLGEFVFKLGYILVKEEEVIKYTDFLKVLDYKRSEQKDIIWSEPFKVND